MARQKSSKQSNFTANKVGKRNVFIISLLLGLILTSAVFAGRGGLFTPQKQRPNSKTVTSPSDPTLLSLNANRPPAKEYVYAGSRLLATESCGYELSAISVFANAGGASGSVNVTAANGCAWDVTSNAAWIQVTPGSGSGNGTVNYTVAQGSSDVAQLGTVTIGDLRFTVVRGIDTLISVSPSTPPTFPSSGGSGTLAVTTDSNRSGFVSNSSANWVTVTSCCGTGLSGTISYVVAPNPGAGRSATITISGGNTPKTVTIKQKSGL
jgi:hypothetical protein